MSTKKVVVNWLFLGVFMLFIQVILGGITRITGSGLSITRWDIIMGSIPPLNLSQWQDAFDLYKETPQYKKINGGMSIGDFKFIFFWEYIHRLWARLMGLVFAIPFFIFLFKKYLNRTINIRLLIVVLLSAITASFGWIMVASGLLDRPWVNAYKLSLHLLLAFITYAYLLWTFFIAKYKRSTVIVSKLFMNGVIVFVSLLWIQIFLGGIVSGMKAGLIFNTWPMMGDSFIPQLILDKNQWSWVNMTRYDEFLFAPTIIQFIHRSIAYILFALGSFIFYQFMKYSYLKTSAILFGISLLAQVILGITILLLSKGSIPILYGVLHQAVAFILLGLSLFFVYKLKVYE